MDLGEWGYGENMGGVWRGKIITILFEKICFQLKTTTNKTQRGGGEGREKGILDTI